MSTQQCHTHQSKNAFQKPTQPPDTNKKRNAATKKGYSQSKSSRSDPYRHVINEANIRTLMYHCHKQMHDSTFHAREVAVGGRTTTRHTHCPLDYNECILWNGPNRKRKNKSHQPVIHIRDKNDTNKKKTVSAVVYAAIVYYKHVNPILDENTKLPLSFDQLRSRLPAWLQSGRHPEKTCTENPSCINFLHLGNISTRKRRSVSDIRKMRSGHTLIEDYNKRENGGGRGDDNDDGDDSNSGLLSDDPLGNLVTTLDDIEATAPTTQNSNMAMIEQCVSSSYGSGSDFDEEDIAMEFYSVTSSSSSTTYQEDIPSDDDDDTMINHPLPDTRSNGGDEHPLDKSEDWLYGETSLHSETVSNTQYSNDTESDQEQDKMIQNVDSLDEYSNKIDGPLHIKSAKKRSDNMASKKRRLS